MAFEAHFLWSLDYFGSAKEQKTTGSQRAIKTREDVVLRSLGEVDEDMPTSDQIEILVEIIPQKVMNLELDPVLDPVDYLESISHGDEVFPEL